MPPVARACRGESVEPGPLGGEGATTLHDSPESDRTLIGRPLRRVEDRRLLTGRGRYVADISRRGVLAAAFLHSTHAHARVLAIRAEAARSAPGVAAAWTAADLDNPAYARGHPFSPALFAQLQPRVQRFTRPLLAQDRVRYAGELLAVVVADSRYRAEDALERIDVDYDPLPAVVDPEAGLAPDAPRIFDSWDDNCQVDYTVCAGDAAAAFQAADVVVRTRTRTHRHLASPLETRGVLADFDTGRGELQVWASTQNPHWLREALAELSGLPTHRIRVVAPDVGGGFGIKIQLYPEELLVPLLAMRLGSPIQWIEDRREHFLCTAHSREQLHTTELAATRDGTLLALRDDAIVDNGAYLDGTVQAYNAAVASVGGYRIPSYSLHYRMVATNKMNQGVYRGAGVPEGNFAVERALDALARELGLDGAELRRKNLIRPDELPYEVGIPFRDGAPVTFHTGDFPQTFQAGLSLADYDGFSERRESARREGRCRGIGLAFFTKGTGAPPHEGARVVVDPGGKVAVYLGSTSQGQGHETVFAQICADALGVRFEDISVRGGDTATLDYGEGARSSRSTILGGSAVHLAALRVRDKILRVASQLLETAPKDLELDDGRVTTRGAPDRALTLAQVARAAAVGGALGEGEEPGLAATEYFIARTVTYVNGVHLAEVEVDPETGAVDIKQYVTVEDTGRVMNPLLVEGQAHGAMAQGIGGALYEELLYDPQGQVTNASFMEYLLPGACEVPPMKSGHVVTPPWPPNPLGVKGAGEGGTVGTAAALAAAVEHALSDYGVRITETPLSPEKIRELIRRA
jgi:carbon-monoxide dehydrogenase large subunit